MGYAANDGRDGDREDAPCTARTRYGEAAIDGRDGTLSAAAKPLFAEKGAAYGEKLSGAFPAFVAEPGLVAYPGSGAEAGTDGHPDEAKALIDCLDGTSALVAGDELAVVLDDGHG